MSYYIRFLVCDDRTCDMEEVRECLENTDPDVKLDFDGITLSGDVIGILTLDPKGSAVYDGDLDVIARELESKREKAGMLEHLDNARFMVAVQPVSSIHDGRCEAIFNALFDELWKRHDGLLVYEGGYCEYRERVDT